MAVKLLLADSYKTYRDRFMETVNRRMPGEITITDSSSSSDLADALSRRQYDILLLDPAVYAAGVNLKNARLVVLLVDEEKRNNLHDDLASFETVHKYQRITDIAGLALRRLAVLPVASAQLQVVFAPLGGTGATTIAAALSFQYAKAGKRTLYVNWENINSTPLFFDCDSGGLSGMWAALRRGDDIKPGIKALIKEDARSQVAYLPLLDTSIDLSRISSGEMRLFMESLMDSGLFDVIVMDGPQRVDDTLLTAFDLAAYIILVEDLSETGLLKTASLLSQPYIIEPYKEKMRMIYNKKPARWNTPKSDIPLVGDIPPLKPAAFRELIENIQQSGLITPFC